MILFELNAAGPFWASAAEDQGLPLVSLSIRTPADQAESRKKLAECSEKSVLLFSDHGMQEGLDALLKSLPDTVIFVPVGSDALLLNRGNAGNEAVTAVNRYLTYGGQENIRSLMAFLRRHLFGDDTAPLPPAPKALPLDGIYTRDQVFLSLDDFLSAEPTHYPVYIGMLSHRVGWLQHNLATEYAIIDALHREGIGVIPVFSSGEKSQVLKSLDFEGIVENFFRKDGKLLIQGLINFQMHLIKGRDGKSISETSVDLFQKLQIPVFHPISSFSVTRDQWEAGTNPLSQEMNIQYLNPEMSGMIEPILVALQSPDRKRSEPLEENITLFAKRVKKWVSLRNTPNSQKKIALMLHNAVCDGVEATLGKAFGLDAFESTVQLMKRLQSEGYTIENIPENGEALRQLILKRKAFSDFRWTGVEDIVNSGGCLYRMPVHPEYAAYFAELPKSMQDAMLASWGPAPGEGMVMGDDLIVTGLNFGNLTVLVQPKRGCYGAKCTGEVCRILHDPTCPPTHQYVAVYRYLERDWQASAIIHMGTDGSLEYLPGKASGLGVRDWPLQVLGSLPNLYPYHLGVPSEGTVAKRRAGAVMVGYYPASSRGLSPEDQQLLDRLDSVQEALHLDNGQADSLCQSLEKELNPTLKKLLHSAPTFPEGLSLVRSALLQCAEGRKLSDLHVLGKNPGHDEAVSYLCEVLRGEEALPKQENEEEARYDRRLRDMVEKILSTGSNELGVKALYEKIMETESEQDHLIAMLNGRFQPPCESGMPDENGRAILPAGRNFYMMKGDSVPTPTAWDRGKILADQLLEAYRADEGGCPHKVAMNMISLDISRTHGEQLSQFLWLLGIRPVWDHTGRVRDLEPIPLAELGRPRIDVTLRISGVMRDTWPGAVALMDRAVMLAADLPESETDNFIRANIRKMEESCGKLSQRAGTIRIFGDPPGAFGAGIDLALKASAWETDQDLARYFIQSSAYAYGENLDGKKAVREFVENARSVDLTTDVTPSRRMDTLSCGFNIQVQGGFKLMAQTLGHKKIRQYQADTEKGQPIRTTTLEQKVQEDLNQTLLNPVWQDHMKTQHYQGAAEIMRLVQTAFDAQCTGEVIRDETLDRLAQDYLGDSDMRDWLLSENPYAAEEIGRRLLEMQSRGKWTPSQEVLDMLRENYLTLEGFLEGGITGDSEIQAGSVEIVRDDQVAIWQNQLRDIDDYLKTLK